MQTDENGDYMRIDLADSNLRIAQPDDWRLLGDITGEAFRDDPINQWVFGKPASIRSMFTTLAREVYVRQGHCYLAGDKGATMWLPPGVEAEPSQVALLKFVLGQLLHGTPTAIGRGMALSEKMAEWHPREPHMYLFSIGTRDSARGKGVGKALLAPVLAACDRESVPVYLENSNPANSGFYAAHGFDRMGVFAVGDDGPVMEPMWREPR